MLPRAAEHRAACSERTQGSALETSRDGWSRDRCETAIREKTLTKEQCLFSVLLFESFFLQNSPLFIIYTFVNLSFLYAMPAYRPPLTLLSTISQIFGAWGGRS